LNSIDIYGSINSNINLINKNNNNNNDTNESLFFNNKNIIINLLFPFVILFSSISIGFLLDKIGFKIIYSLVIFLNVS
jgi:hypothetical protein